jgi:hypothetical protein
MPEDRRNGDIPAGAPKPDELGLGPLFEQDAYREGFGWKTIWGALFVGFIVLPGAIYMGLVTGQSLAGAAQWVTIILFIEIAKRSFVQLRKQEIIILYWVAGGLVVMGGQLGTGADMFGGPFGSLIWNQWLVRSPQAAGFDLTHLIPPWVAPPPDSPGITSRTFLASGWVFPIAMLVGHVVLMRVASLSLSYSLYRVTNDIERLEFPMATVTAGGILALAETSQKSEGWRWRIFSIGSVMGVIYGIVYVALPTVTGAVSTSSVQLIPIPYIDLSDQVGRVLPTAIFGIWTDLSWFFMGFVLPFWVVVGEFIGSVLVRLIINPFLYHFGILHTWKPGMEVRPASICSMLDFYISFTIGSASFIALIGIVSVVSVLIRRVGRRSVSVTDEAWQKAARGRGDIPLKLAVGIWLVATSIYVIVSHKLVPLFPLPILLFFAFVWSPLFSYIGARMLGITGVMSGISFPFLREGTFILSGYKGADIWFAPVPMWEYGSGTQAWKELELTRTKYKSYVKMTFAVVVIVLVCSFLFWSMIWRLGNQVPSSAYPYVQKFWPYWALLQSVWVSSTIGDHRSFVVDAIRWPYISAGGIAAFSLYAIIRLTGLPVGLFYGIISGVGVWPHNSLPMFCGALLSRFVLAKRFGEKKWRAYAPILLAGYAAGMALMAMASTAIALLARSINQIVY